jgi:hypothetical protein
VERLLVEGARELVERLQMLAVASQIDEGFEGSLRTAAADVDSWTASEELSSRNRRTA